MRKRDILIAILCLLIGSVWYIPAISYAAESGKENRQVPVLINAANFPDERFRCLADELDKDHDQVLSGAERSALKELRIEYQDYCSSYRSANGAPARAYSNRAGSAYTLEWYKTENREFQKLSLQGIEYFPELWSYSVIGYLETEGQLNANSKLTDICLADADRMGFDDIQYVDNLKLEREFPLEQLKRIRLGVGLHFEELSLRRAVELIELELGHNDIYGRGDYSNPRTTTLIGTLDLTNNKKLRKITLFDVKTKSIDLRKNKELREVNIGGHPVWQDFFEDGKPAGTAYTISNSNTKLKLPAKNKIYKLQCMAFVKQIDIVSCRKLQFLRVHENVLVKMNRNWFEKYGKKKMRLYVRGTRTKIKVKRKTKKYVYVKTRKLADQHLDDDHYTHG